MPEPGENEPRKEFVQRCIPIVIDEGTAEDGAQAAAICNSIWRESKKMRQPGPITIKSQTDTEAIVAGYGVVFGGKDLEGETFTKETELELGYVPTKSIFYDHTLDAKANGSLGKTLSEDIDDVGVWVEAQIDRSKDYANAVLELVGQGIIGFSSGTASHLARRKNGKILRWPVVEYSLTPTPAEPRTLGVSQIKALFDAAGLQMPEAFNEADEANAAEKSGGKTQMKEVKAMDEKEPKVETPVVDTKAIADLVMAQMKAEFETKAADEVKFQARLTEEKKKWEADLPAWAGGFNLMKIAEPGSDVGGNKAFRHWLRTGDRIPYGKVYAEAAKNQIEVNDDLSEVKAALQGQTDAEGGYLVPDDFFNQVVAKRDD